MLYYHLFIVVLLFTSLNTYSFPFVTQCKELANLSGKLLIKNMLSSGIALLLPYISSPESADALCLNQISPIMLISFVNDERIEDIANQFQSTEKILEFEDEVDSETEKLKLVIKPINYFDILKKKLSLNSKQDRLPLLQDDTTLEDSIERVLTLKAYLDEAERDLFQKNWKQMIIYLNIFTDQENAFLNTINKLYPSNDELNKAYREEMTLKVQTMFLAIDDLRESARDNKFDLSRSLYAKLLLSYDGFIKAGNLYPTYDVISSRELLFKQTPRSTLRFNTKAVPGILDHVVLISGPDMGKTGVIIDIDPTTSDSVVKFDKDDSLYQEVKEMNIKLLAKPL